MYRRIWRHVPYLTKIVGTDSKRGYLENGDRPRSYLINRLSRLKSGLPVLKDLIKKKEIVDGNIFFFKI